jgi:hypothetical protein
MTDRNRPNSGTVRTDWTPENGFPALAGLVAGEAVTIPSLVGIEPWATLEAARIAFMKATLSGQVSQRYYSR